MTLPGLTQQVAPLQWVPWYATEVSDLKGINWVWPIIQDVCLLPDPALFPVIDCEWQPDQLKLLERYSQVCMRLVATTVFQSDGRVRINVLGGTVEKSVPADDVTLGFTALLRQVFHPGEEASFDRIRRILGRAAHETDAAAAREVLGAWRDAHRTLLNEHLRALIETMARNRGLLSEVTDSHGARLLVSESISPRTLVDAYLNGDQLHYGEGRDDLERWSQDKATAAMMEINARADAVTLAHFYAGFAGIVRVVLGVDWRLHLGAVSN
jgi:hypothetical protein